MQKFYITTPIYYPNARPHVGSAYTTIVCDAIARYKRMCGYDVALLTGTDEHGEKLERAAAEAGKSPGEFVAEKRELFKELWRTLGIGEFLDASASGAEVAAGLSPQRENDGVKPPPPPMKYLFVHTSQNPAHRAAVQWMVRQADTAGYIEKKKYEGRYCIFDERYVSDSPEPVNCDICGRPAELISEENYFFRLSAFQDRLLKHYEDHPEFVLPDFRMNEMKSFVKSGLRDISISRHRLKWGIPWPGDDEQVVYVWYDALTSYLTGIGFEGDTRSKDFEKFWPADLHMIGKDILRFHAVYWPAFLWAAGLQLPKTIFAHGWIYYEQDKMSKSKGNVVYPEPIIKAFEEFGAPGNDALRYYLLRDTPFGLDGSFSYEGLIQRYNSDLANDLGNLASRTLKMICRYCDGNVPLLMAHAASGTDSMLPRVAEQARTYNVNCFGRLEFVTGIAEAWRLIGVANSELNQNRPWALAAGVALPLGPFQRQQVDRILGDAYELLRFVAVLAQPVLPTATSHLWRQMGQQSSLGEFDAQSLRWGQPEAGKKVGKPEPIFPRLKKEEVLRRLHELAEQDRTREQTTQEAPAKVEPPIPNPESRTPNPEPPSITIDDFSKVDLRVGTILSAEPISGATKLLKLQVDIGAEVRQICAGIAEYYSPEQLIGMKVVIVANLQPRKLRGVESNGMVVAASLGEHGKPVLATFLEDVPNGTKLR